nr:zinc finger, CCHC-type [Tanacetum cinerariifolium]
MTSSITRFDIEKFDGKNDFGLWQIKMCALMVQHGCDVALDTLPADMKAGTKLGDHIDEFNKLILNLANIDIEIEDEDQAHMLFTLLPSSYENFMETLLYGMESLTMKDVLATLNSKELNKRTKGTKEETSDGLYVKGRYVPGLRRSLISLGTLEKEGYTINMQMGRIKVRANITITGVPGQKDAEGNVAEKKKVKESIEAYLGKLLKYNACLTRWSPIRGSSTRKRC